MKVQRELNSLVFHDRTLEDRDSTRINSGGTVAEGGRIDVNSVCVVISFDFLLNLLLNLRLAVRNNTLILNDGIVHLLPKFFHNHIGRRNLLLSRRFLRAGIVGNWIGQQGKLRLFVIAGIVRLSGSCIRRGTHGKAGRAILHRSGGGLGKGFIQVIVYTAACQRLILRLPLLSDSRLHIHGSRCRFLGNGALLPCGSSVCRCLHILGGACT